MSSPLLLGLFITITVIIGYHLRFLTRSGSVAAAGVGFVISHSIGVKGLLLLGIFFVTSSLWSKFRRNQKKRIEERHEKTSRRDYQQVIANGGAAALLSVLYAFDAQLDYLLAFCVVIASANSDTWSSEIGTLSKTKPFSFRTWNRVEKGSSGAVSLLGTMVGVLGALMIAISAGCLFALSLPNMMAVLIFGVLGNLIDTFIGAYFQPVYECRVCRVETEKLLHCSNSTQIVRGWKYLNNDAVNLLSGIMPALLVLILY